MNVLEQVCTNLRVCQYVAREAKLSSRSLEDKVLYDAMAKDFSRIHLRLLTHHFTYQDALKHYEAKWGKGNESKSQSLPQSRCPDCRDRD